MDSNSFRKFYFERCLGRGGFGEVYKARLTQPGGLSTAVAIKVLLADLDDASQPVERLRDEGGLLARLDHPAILKAFDVVVVDGRVALVAEYVDGQDLTECIPPTGVAPAVALVHAARPGAGATCWRLTRRV